MGQERKPWRHRVADFGRDHTLIDNRRILDVLKREALKRHRFLQIGALDFVSFDPLVEFVNVREWTIDFVEPQPFYANLLRSRYVQFENVKVHELCVADASGVKTLYYVDPDAVAKNLVPDWAAGIASLHLDRNALGGLGCSPVEFDLIKRHICSIDVRCEEVGEFLSRFSEEPPTIIWIDIEGEDMSVVNALDLNVNAPAIIKVEAINMEDDDLESSFSKFSRNGYHVGFFDNDMVAIRTDLK